ncbi:hypothetical protein [Prosthecobacter sp.]|uniref:hypothetical protein n=1 Tax=Prosthecobacter sp. TaxID=1965333 RepID=UPI001D24D29C|nr:hypothetical protein [Prosthecobacter sp.]MCB1277877.1 hypothetical protein [Prosthecobacter sp.]
MQIPSIFPALPHNSSLYFIWGRVVLFSLLATPALLQAAPSTGDVVREHHNREIEQIANHLSGDARVDDYFSYVLLPLLGLLGLMFCLRRIFLR